MTDDLALFHVNHVLRRWLRRGHRLVLGVGPHPSVAASPRSGPRHSESLPSAPRTYAPPILVEPVVFRDHRSARLGVALRERVKEALRTESMGQHPPRASKADSGIGTGERTRGASFLARLAIRAAISPIRSRSRLTLRMVRTRRKSDATGSNKARTRKHSRSMATSRRSISRSIDLDLGGEVGPLVAEALGH